MSNLPSVVIVGRPNVGKSTLFNAILKSRRSIVGDEPGITRDRIYGEGSHHGRRFQLVDTGGIITDDAEMIPTQILKQARVALTDAACVIFLIDGRAEITGADRELAAMLRKLGKDTVLAVNKIDAQSREGLAHEFHALGFKHQFSISAEHHLGLSEMLDYVTETFEKKPEPEEDPDAKKPIKVAIIGRPNVGKSTLLNSLTGMERAIVSPIAGTTRDAVDETIKHNGVEFTFVDTAGIRRKGKTKEMAEKLSVVMARRHLRMSHVAILMMDATEGVLALDATIAGYAHEEGRAVVLCVNKWDTVETPGKRKFQEQIKERLKFLDYASVVFISALTGDGVKDLFPKIRKAYDAASVRIGTGELNRFVETLRWEYEPRLKYITQASIRPPTFVAFTDSSHKLHFSAERFLINRLRERFGFEGTPVVVKPQRQPRP
ncbi:MAG: ribosome biogenesis GTPase Der [Acidobacteriota bacterium]